MYMPKKVRVELRYGNERIAQQICDQLQFANFEEKDVVDLLVCRENRYNDFNRAQEEKILNYVLDTVLRAKRNTNGVSYSIHMPDSAFNDDGERVWFDKEAERKFYSTDPEDHILKVEGNAAYVQIPTTGEVYEYVAEGDGHKFVKIAHNTQKENN